MDMEENEWIDNLQEKKVKEFSFFPCSFTRMKKGLELEIPDIDLEGDEKKEEKDTNKNAPSGSTVKTLTLTIGGLAIGVAMGATGATLANSPTSCTATPGVPTTQTSSQTAQPRTAPVQTQTVPAQPATTQSSGGTPAAGTR